MCVYQTALYSAKFINTRFGWDYDTLIFESKTYDNPTDAMLEFNQEAIVITKWIATIKTIVDGEVLAEEIFDSTVIKEV
jgi:hypothetical protein